MSEKRPVVVYGVSGYTGRLVCEYLREYNVPFIAAGRDAAKVRAVVEKIPGIETADYEVVQVEHSVEALTKLFRGARFVSNMVGPFIKYGSEVVEAFFAAGWTKENLVDTVVAIGDKIVTNYLHSTTKIPVDFPAAPKLD